MSDSDKEKAPTPEAGGADDGAPKAEYLKPEAGARDSRPKTPKEPRVLEGKAEEVSEEKSGKAEASAPKTATQERKGGVGSAVLAGGIAGLGGAAIAAAVIWSGVLPIGTREGEGLAALSARIDALETSRDEASSSLAQRIDRLATRIDGAERDIQMVAEAPGSAAENAARFEALDGEVQTLKSALGDTRDMARDLREALSALEGRMPPEGIGSRVESIDALVKALDLRLASLLPDIEKMEARVAALEEEAEDPDAAARAALGLALANLARAAESAGSFETELGVVRRFLPDEPELAALNESAKSGVPTRAALEARFPSLAQSVFDAERRATEDGLWSRFVSNAKSLVTIRRTGEISGETSEAIVARMEERLKAHDLGGSVAEAETLSGPAAEAASGWIADARARLETDRLVRELSARLAGELAGMRG